MPNAPANVLRYLRHLAADAELDRLPDQELLGRFAAAQDEDAFAALVRRHGPMVLRLCRRSLPTEHDAEDVFQATFLVLCRKATSLRRQGPLAGWLYGVAYRLALKARTQAARRRARESRAATGPPRDPLAEISVREAQDILDRELLKLPDKLRAPLVLCCLEGLTRDEAAQRLGWSVGLVKSRLEQARELLGKRLARRGLASGAAFLAVFFAGQTAPAAVPASLAEATVRAALLFAAEGAAAAGVPASAVALTEELLTVSVWSKLTVATAGLLLAGLIGLGSAEVAISGAPAVETPPPQAQVAPKDGAKVGTPVAAAARTEAPPVEKAILPSKQADVPPRQVEAVDAKPPPRRGEDRRANEAPAAAPRPVRGERRDDDWWEHGLREQDDDWRERGSREKERARKKNRPKRDDHR